MAAEVLGKGEGSTVQIAAVVQQQDADQVVDSLKHKGYTAAVLHEPQDKAAACADWALRRA